MRKGFPLLLVLLLATASLGQTITVEAEEPEEGPSTVGEVWADPIVFEEFSSYIRLNFSMFTVDFYKGDYGYNVLYDKSGEVVVYEERQALQYWTGSNWRQRGEPFDLTWVQVDDYHYNVTRHYQDYEGNWYNVTFIVRLDEKVKSVISIESGQTDEYRLLWQLTGIVHENWTKSENQLIFGNASVDYGWIGFDWSDVYQSFGDITETSVESVAQGRKADIYFNLGVIEAGQNLVVDPSTVGTTTLSETPLQTYQRKTFYANGRYWVFWATGTTMQFSSSTDSSSWESPTSVRSAKAQNFDIYWDGTYFHYGCQGYYGANDRIYYRRGTPNSDGSVTWSAAESSITIDNPIGSAFASVAVDSSGYPWMTYWADDDCGYAIKADANDGTFVVAGGFPDYISQRTNHKIVPLTGGKMYVISNDGFEGLYGKRWNGASWDSGEEFANCRVSRWSVTTDGDTIHVIYDRYTGGTGTWYIKRTTGWGSGAQLWATAGLYTSITVDEETDDLYAFRLDAGTDKIYYRKYSTYWESEVELVYDSQMTGSVNAYYNVLNNKIGMIYRKGTSSPWSLRFTTLSMVVAPTVNTLSATLIEETTANPRGEVTATGGENPTRYIQYGTSTGSYPSEKNCGVGGTGIYNSYLTGLTPGQEYFYRAKAVNTGGTGYGSEMTFFTKPNDPSGLSATAVGETQIDLAWTKGTGADKTHIRRKIGSYPTSISDGDQAYYDTGVSKEDTGLVAGNDYYYRGWAYDTDSGYYSDGYTEDWARTPQTHKAEVTQSLSLGMGWLEGWEKRLKITLDHNDIDAALSDFPVMIYLSTSSGRYSEDVSFVFDELGSDANRKKIALTKADGVSECYVEVEKWDHSGEQAWLWAKIPDISSTVDTDLYFYYDSTHADNTNYVGDPNSTPAENVWDSSFRLVLHMGDDPDTSNVRDSTDYDNDGVKKGSNEPIEIAGKIGKGQNFDGSDDFITLDAHIADFASLTTGTIECWIKNDAWPQGANILVSAGDKTDAASDLYHFTIPSDFHYQSREAGAGLLYMNAEMTPTAGVWWYYVMSVDVSGGKLYVDSVDVTHISQGTNQFFDDINDLDFLRIGNRVDSDVNSYHTDGIIDEVRISSSKRTGPWIKATYETGRDDLFDFESEETPGGGLQAIRILSAVRIPTQEITTSSNSLRSWQTSRVAVQSVSPVFEGNRKWDTTRIAAQTIVTVLEGNRMLSALRNPEQTIQVNFETGRLWALMKKATQSISAGFNAERSWSMLRSMSQSLGITSGAGRTLSAIRVLTQSITSTFNTERLWSTMRTVSQGIVASANAIKTGNYLKILAQGVSTTFNTGRTWSTTRALTQSITAVFNANRVLVAIRILPQTLTASFNSLRSWSLLKTVAQSISLNASMGRSWDTSRLLTQALSQTFNVERLWSTTREIVQAVSLSSNTERLWSLSRAFTQGLSTTFNGERILTAVRGMSQMITAVFNGERLWDTMRIVSQEISATANTIKTGNYLKILAQGIFTVFNTERYWITSRVLMQEISASFNAHRIWSLMRTASQGMSLSLEGNRIIALIRSATQEITTTFNIEKTWDAVRIASQSIASTFDIERVWSTSRTITQGISTIFNGNRLLSLSRMVSQSISTGFNAFRTGTFTRIISQSVSFIPNTFTHLYEFLAETVTLTITTAFNAIREWSLLRNMVQTLTANFNTERGWTLLRTLMQTVGTSFESGRLWTALRVASQSVSTSLNVERLCAFPREAYQGLMFVFDVNTFVERFAHIFRFVSVNIELTTQAIRSWSLSRTFSQGLSFISGVSVFVGELKMSVVSLVLNMAIELNMFVQIINEFSVASIMLNVITLLSTGKFLVKGRDTAWGAISTFLWFITGLAMIQSNPEDWIALRMYMVFGTIMVALTLISALRNLDPEDQYFEDWE